MSVGAPSSQVAASSSEGWWLTRLGALELVVYALWAARALSSGADFSALAGFFFLLPLWALVGLLACYHLLRTPELRLRAGLYLFVPGALFGLVWAVARMPDASLVGTRLVWSSVLLGLAWALWDKRGSLMRLARGVQVGRSVHIAVSMILAGLSLIWLLVTMHFGGVADFESVLRHDHSLAQGAGLLWLVSALLCLIVAPYAVLGLILPFGRSRRLLYALELLLVVVLALTLIVPSIVAIVVLATALSG